MWPSSHEKLLVILWIGSTDLVKVAIALNNNLRVINTSHVLSFSILEGYWEQ